MLKAYAVALVLSSSAPVNADTQETVRPLEKQQAETSTELHRPKPGKCFVCGTKK
ncbi:hypothetical protein [Salinimonas chungwhensis]|uniref:hypothetical protein n=1 Tax=Salinimonas chungwhensis TaxID=265425 RepID=UPI00037BF6A4|nr:hypothetical protein [Salinimonas chungwhensis]